jgi:hypothetical protein
MGGRPFAASALIHPCMQPVPVASMLKPATHIQRADVKVADICLGHTHCPQHFLSLFVDSALVAADAAALRGMRAKRRVLLVRFIAKVSSDSSQPAACFRCRQQPAACCQVSLGH